MPLRPDMELTEYLEILRRRKWYVTFSMVLVLFGASVLCVVLPEMYKSSSTILVISQKVPQDYVRSTISTRVEERLFLIQQQVLSRTHLSLVMDELGLFKKERAKEPIEDVVEKMRKRIEIQVASSVAGAGRRDRNDDAFTITFVHENPRMAMLTASRLASFFIDENLKSREQQAAGTAEFLASQLKETKARLEAQEEKVKRYKLQYMGELPQQMQANLQILSRMQDQLRANSDAIRTANDRRVFLEAQLATLEAQLLAVTATAPSGAGNDALASPADEASPLAVELAAKKAELESLSLKYTPQYPDIRRLKGEIAGLEKQLKESAGKEVTGAASMAARRGLPGGAPAPGARERVEIGRLRAQRAAIDSEIASLQKQNAEIQKNLAALEAKVERSPRREQEMVALTRDYENLKASYDDLLKKKLDAEVAENLERRQKGEQFQILDPAAIPVKPFSPDRKRIFGIAVAAALLVGFGGAFGREMLEPSLRSKKDFLSYFQVPVLATIPVIRDEQVEQRKNRKSAIAFGVLATILLALTVFLAVFSTQVHSFLERVV